jgi:hypothetical protein
VTTHARSRPSPPWAKYRNVKRTKLRKGYQHLRELTPTELAQWFDAIERACQSKERQP